MIGILDSGLGGLTVLNALKALLPDYDLLYYGDTAHAPYGGRSPDTIVRLADRSLAFLVEQGVRMVVVACNTISSLATDHFRNSCGLPVLGAVAPAVSQALAVSKRSRIGVMGSPATVMSRVHETGIRAARPHAAVYSAAAPLLVPLIEADLFKRPESRMILKKYLRPLKARQIDTLILGCNHYALEKKTFQRKAGQQVRLVDPVAELALSVQRYLTEHEDIRRVLGRNGLRRYCLSDLTEEMARTAGRVFGCDGRLEKVVLDPP